MQQDINIVPENDEEKVKPLKTIVVSGTKKDVQSVYFKEQHAMSAYKFKTDLKTTIGALESNQDIKSSQFR